MINRAELVQRAAKRNKRGFTLVELLVVIGIIALLISILLPSLNKARKAAITLKCASALRELGHAYDLYATDNNGWWPPIKLAPATGSSYTIGNVTYTTPGAGNPQQLPNGSWTIDFSAYWYNFVEKYLTRNHIGTGATQINGTRADATKSLFWGCPEWGAGYAQNAEDQPGYGVNNYPTFSTSDPNITSAAPYPDSKSGNAHNNSIVSNWAGGGHGGTTGLPAGDYAGSFYQAKDYTHPSDRALAMDCAFWQVLSYYAPKGTTLSQEYIPANLLSAIGPLTAGETWAALYRHGEAPKIVTSGGTGRGQVSSTGYDPNGGRPSYNILYCDGHVITSNDKADAFRSVRMRYPDP